MEYNDLHYLDDYASYYARTYKTYGRFCRRLHFFSNKFRNDDLYGAIVKGGKLADALTAEGSYLGFVVARPLPGAVLGRTVLQAPNADGESVKYTAVLKKTSVGFFGLSLTVKNALPFQEQDTNVAACATIALWSAFNKTSAMFGTQSPHPTAITVSGNKVRTASRVFPSDGLTTSQMCQAVVDAGLEPEVYPVNKSTPLLTILYSYVSMGLPVILIVYVKKDTLHAVTVTGFSLKDLPLQDGERHASDISFVGHRIDRIFVHDDGIGPFEPLEVRKANDAERNEVLGTKHGSPIAFSSLWMVGNQKLTMFPSSIIVPAHPKMRVRFEPVEAAVRYLTEILKNNKITEFKGYLQEMRGDDTILGFEWAPRYVRLNSYKKELRTRALHGGFMDTDETRFLLESQPRFLWCISLLIGGHERMEILFDATDCRGSSLVRAVTWPDPLFKKRFRTVLRAERSKIDDALGTTFVKPFLT